MHDPGSIRLFFTLIYILSLLSASEPAQIRQLCIFEIYHYDLPRLLIFFLVLRVLSLCVSFFSRRLRGSFFSNEIEILIWTFVVLLEAAYSFGLDYSYAQRHHATRRALAFTKQQWQRTSTHFCWQCKKRTNSEASIEFWYQFNFWSEDNTESI